MNWLEFISVIVQALIWPAAFSFLFWSFRKEITAFLDANRVKRIKGGPFEAEFFESVSKAREALEGAKELNEQPDPDENLTEGQLPSRPKTEYQDDVLLNHRPEYAVLESWKELERVLQLAANSVSIDKRRYRPIRQVIFDLVRKEAIQSSMGEALLELNDARNAIVHAEDFKISRAQAEEYISLVEAALQSLQNFSEGN